MCPRQTLRAVIISPLNRAVQALFAIGQALVSAPWHLEAMEGLMVIVVDNGVWLEAMDLALLIEAVHSHYENLSTSNHRLQAKIAGQAL